jgi:hypothetical protein
VRRGRSEAPVSRLTKDFGRVKLENQSASAAAARQRQNERTRRVSGDESPWILNLAHYSRHTIQVTTFTFPKFVTAKRLIEHRFDVLTFQRSLPTSSDKAHPKSCFTSTEGRGVGGNKKKGEPFYSRETSNRHSFSIHSLCHSRLCPQTMTFSSSSSSWQLRVT